MENNQSADSNSLQRNNIYKFNCEIISDFFVGNASTSVSEMRPSSFEGVLRFWWRAMHYNLTAKELRRQEAEFFGGSYFDDNGKEKHTMGSYRFLSIHQTNSNTQLKSTDRPKEIDPRGGKGKSKAIGPNQKFTIKLQIRENKKQVFALFYLASILGGVGKRSRRGAGCWRILSTEPESQIEEISLDTSSIEEYINKNINGEFKLNLEVSDNKFPFIKQIQIGKTSYGNQKELRLHIMNTAHDFHDMGVIDYRKYLGYTEKSSPIIVSIIEINDTLYPIVTTLWTENGKDKRCRDLQKDFKNAILSQTEQ